MKKSILITFLVMSYFILNVFSTHVAKAVEPKYEALRDAIDKKTILKSSLTKIGSILEILDNIDIDWKDRSSYSGDRRNLEDFRKVRVTSPLFHHLYQELNSNIEELVIIEKETEIFFNLFVRIQNQLRSYKDQSDSKRLYYSCCGCDDPDRIDYLKKHDDEVPTSCCVPCLLGEFSFVKKGVNLKSLRIALTHIQEDLLEYQRYVDDPKNYINQFESKLPQRVEDSLNMNLAPPAYGAMGSSPPVQKMTHGNSHTPASAPLLPHLD